MYLSISICGVDLSHCRPTWTVEVQRCSVRFTLEYRGEQVSVHIDGHCCCVHCEPCRTSVVTSPDRELKEDICLQQQFMHKQLQPSKFTQWMWLHKMLIYKWHSYVGDIDISYNRGIRRNKPCRLQCSDCLCIEVEWWRSRLWCSPCGYWSSLSLHYSDWVWYQSSQKLFHYLVAETDNILKIIQYSYIIRFENNQAFLVI